MPRKNVKNVCVACPTHSKEGIALLFIGFILAFQSSSVLKLAGILIILFSYFLPSIRKKWGE